MSAERMEASNMNHLVDIDVGLTDAIFHRHAVRNYSDREVSAERVKQLLLSAARAPSAMNQQQ